MKRVILASGSVYRKAQLTQIGIQAESIAPNIDESTLPNEAPLQLAERLALAKAKALLPQAHMDTDIIIGGDQTACLDAKQLQKPGSRTNAIAQLQHCSGREVVFYSSVCVLSQGRQLISTTQTLVKFRTLSTDAIAAYIDVERPFDCAGSFKCEGLGITLFERITSDDPSALIGLPLIALTGMLMQVGHPPLLRARPTANVSG